MLLKKYLEREKKLAGMSAEERFLEVHGRAPNTTWAQQVEWGKGRGLEELAWWLKETGIKTAGVDEPVCTCFRTEKTRDLPFTLAGHDCWAWQCKDCGGLTDAARVGV